MKRTNLIRHLEKHGCIFICEGGSHTIYKNPSGGKMSSVPRHREVKEFLARKICWRQLSEPQAVASG